MNTTNPAAEVCQREGHDWVTGATLDAMPRCTRCPALFYEVNKPPAPACMQGGDHEWVTGGAHVHSSPRCAHCWISRDDAGAAAASRGTGREAEVDAMLGALAPLLSGERDVRTFPEHIQDLHRRPGWGSHDERRAAVNRAFMETALEQAQHAHEIHDDGAVAQMRSRMAALLERHKDQSLAEQVQAIFTDFDIRPKTRD